MALEQVTSRVEHVDPLRSSGRELGANREVVGCSGLSSVAPRDLLLEFHHLQVTLCPVVRKGHREACRESQHGIAIASEAFSQVRGDGA